MKVPPWIIVGFHHRDREDSQNLNKDNFFRLPVTSAQGIMGTEKHVDGSILLNWDHDDYSQGYGQNKETFRALTKDNTFQQFISDHDFKVDFGYKLYVFRIRHQKKMLQMLNQIN